MLVQRQVHALSTSCLVQPPCGDAGSAARLRHSEPRESPDRYGALVSPRQAW